MTFIGIDPGKAGGLAIINDKGELEVLGVLSDKMLVKELELCTVDESFACVEKVGAMPGQGVVSMFTFGKGAGFIEGVLSAYGIPYQLVAPQTWKKEFGLNKSKDASVDVCARLFPEADLKASPRCRKNHDGMAEALLMAEWARRKLGMVR